MSISCKNDNAAAALLRNIVAILADNCHKAMDSKERHMIGLLKQKKVGGGKLENFRRVLAESKNRVIHCRSYPIWLAIDPTNICMLKCPFCPTGFGNIKRKKGMMKLEEFKKIMDILGPYLLHIDMQNWGEPLLNKDIYGMIGYAKRFGVHITLSTNFQNFDENSAEAIIDSGLDRLILSIDGASQETYGKYRRGGSFGKAIENIKLLVAKKKKLKSAHPTVIWQFLVFRHNEHEIEAARDMGAELGVDDVGINSAFIAVDSEEYKSWVPSDKKYSRYDLSLPPEKRSGSDSFLRSIVKPFCNWPWQGITVNWDGSVSPCCGVYLEEEDFGNIFSQDDFSRLWNNAHYRVAREFIRKGGKGRFKTGNTCVNCKKIGQINIDLCPDFWIRG